MGKTDGAIERTRHENRAKWEGARQSRIFATVLSPTLDQSLIKRPENYAPVEYTCPPTRADLCVERLRRTRAQWREWIRVGDSEYDCPCRNGHSRYSVYVSNVLSLMRLANHSADFYWYRATRYPNVAANYI